MRSLPSCSLTISPTFVGDVNIFGAGSEPWFWTTHNNAIELPNQEAYSGWFPLQKRNDEVPRNHRHFTSSRSQASLTGREPVVDLRSQGSRVAHKKNIICFYCNGTLLQILPRGCYKESRVDMARNTGSWRWDPTIGNRYTEWNEEISPIIRNKRNKDEKNKTNK